MMSYDVCFLCSSPGHEQRRGVGSTNEEEGGGASEVTGHRALAEEQVPAGLRQHERRLRGGRYQEDGNGKTSTAA